MSARWAACLLAAWVAMLGGMALADGGDPTVRRQHDGSTKHLLSGYVCPAGMRAQAQRWQFSCGLVLVVPRTGGYDTPFEAARQLRFDIMAGRNHHAPEAKPYSASGLPRSITIGGVTAKAVDMSTAMMNGGEPTSVTIGWSAVIGAWEVGSSASLVDAATVERTVADAVRDLSRFAAANRGLPVPEPIKPERLAAYLVGQGVYPALEASGDSVRHRDSGLTCPLLIDQGIPRLQEVGSGTLWGLRCWYSSSYGRLEIAVRPADEWSEEIWCGTKDLGDFAHLVPMRLRGRELRMKNTYCTAQKMGTNNDMFVSYSENGDWFVEVQAVIANPKAQAPSRIMRIASRRVKPLSHNRSAGRARFLQIWNAVAGANAAAR